MCLPSVIIDWFFSFSKKLWLKVRETYNLHSISPMWFFGFMKFWGSTGTFPCQPLRQESLSFRSILIIWNFTFIWAGVFYSKNFFTTLLFFIIPVCHLVNGCNSTSNFLKRKEKFLYYKQKNVSFGSCSHILTGCFSKENIKSLWLAL